MNFEQVPESSIVATPESPIQRRSREFFMAMPDLTNVHMIEGRIYDACGSLLCDMQEWTPADTWNLEAALQSGEEAVETLGDALLSYAEEPNSGQFEALRHKLDEVTETLETLAVIGLFRDQLRIVLSVVNGQKTDQ